MHMETKPARIRLSMHEGVLEIEGSEEFVSQQVESLKHLILKVQPLAPIHSATGTKKDTKAGEPEAVSTGTIGRDYESIFSLDEGVVKIIKSIPGSNKAKQVANAAILYLFGKSLVDQQDASFKELRQLCRDHGCLDENNFSATLKGQKQYLVISGTGKSQKAKLTMPGKRQAQVLIQSLDAE